MHTDKQYLYIGSFDLDSAKRLCDLLEKQQIDFELEIDDTPIRNLTPFEAALGGTYGAGASANVYVKAGAFDQCQALLGELFL